MSKNKSYLSSGTVSLAELRDVLRRTILNCVSQHSSQGNKLAMVIDPSLVGELGLIAEFSALRERNVEKISPIDVPSFPGDYPRTVLYFTRPKTSLLNHIKNHVMADQGRREEREYTVYFVPRKNIACKKALEALQISALVQVGEYPLGLLPLDSDLLSMELPLCYRDARLAGDRTDLFLTAQGLMQLQSIFGLIPRIVGKGELAKHVGDLLLRMSRESNAITAAPEIDTVVLIDRGIDLVTPCLTQLTYEGLTDELLGINTTMVELPLSVAPPGPTGKAVKAPLNSGDKLFAEIRDMHMAAVGPLLGHRARTLRAEFEERHDAKTVSQIHSFTSKIKRMQEDQLSLKLHTDLATFFNGAAKSEAFTAQLDAEQVLLGGADADKTNEYVEDCIARKEELTKVLRLVCLHSVLCNGLKPKVFESYRRDIIHVYGHEYLVPLDQLAKCGLLCTQEGRPSFPLLRKSLRLLTDTDTGSPSDISYVYNGYAPISVRVAHLLAGPDWRSSSDTLSLLPGPEFEHTQTLPTGLTPRAREGEGTRPPVTLVVFLGGCTFAEISALRFLSHTEERDYIVGTTSLITGTTLLNSFLRNNDRD
eukprot:m.23195 g.23195  ORF g.23195 m.23195 type:complete len:593 (+) comp8436_c0_seq1:30-1808(+)